MSGYEQFEATAVELACAAGGGALEAFRASVALEFKGRKQNDPVTVLDRQTETFLRQELREAFPAHGLLGEEHADDIAAEAEYVWVLDPIDGTANFASGLPLWGISIGLLHLGAPVVGCIWVPVGPGGVGPGAYHARAGGGAWFDDQPVCVSKADDERGQIMALPGDYLRAFRIRRAERGASRAERALPDARTTGSCTAELVLIAAGALRAGVFVRPSIWDVAAGAVIVREAGGSVLTWQDRRWQPFERFEPAAPLRGRGDAALRHWGRPLVMGAPEAVERIVARLAWHPRLPRRLQKLFGLDQPG
jgi:myo-inositol-1(or 4)-monophosphatase